MLPHIDRDPPPRRPRRVPPDRPWLLKPPVGMWYEAREGEKPFRARWRLPGGRKEGKKFATAEERAKFAAEWVKRRALVGRAVKFVDGPTLEIWAEFKRITHNTSPIQVAREWAEMKLGRGACAITVTEAVDTYLKFRLAGKLSADTVRHFEKHLRERFVGAFGARELREISDEEIGEWLDELKHPRTGAAMDPLTRRHHRKDVNTFFEWCVRAKRWIARNPCDGVPIPASDEKDVALLTLDEGRRLFAANEGQRIAGRLALEAFGSLRASSAGRLRREDVDFAARGLRLRGAEHKSGKTRFRQGHPDNLWAWLNRAPDEMWAMEWWEYRNEKREAFARARIAGGSENRLRKTCLSAHLAWLKNQPFTSLLAQHRHTSTTEIYLGTMTEADGRAWFGIGPSFIGAASP